MTQQPTTTAPIKPKQTLGEQVRKIADQLKQETHLQIKATSRILGAAAQIAENHDRLIDEVTDMVEDDLHRQSQASQPKTYTSETLTQEFKTLREAKAHFELKANSWEALANKLNSLADQKSASIDTQTSVLERLATIENDIKVVQSKTNEVLLLLKQLICEKE
jgi:hypothetical protein